MIGIRENEKDLVLYCSACEERYNAPVELRVCKESPGKWFTNWVSIHEECEDLARDGETVKNLYEAAAVISKWKLDESKDGSSMAFSKMFSLVTGHPA